MNKAYRVFATALAATCLTSCLSSVKTFSKLFNISVGDVTNLVIIYNPENKVCDYDVEKKDVFLEKLLNTEVTISEPCDCLGLYNIEITTTKDRYRINEFYANSENKHYNYTIKDENSIDDLVKSYLDGSL